MINHDIFGLWGVLKYLMQVCRIYCALGAGYLLYFGSNLGDTCRTYRRELPIAKLSVEAKLCRKREAAKRSDPNIMSLSERSDSCLNHLGSWIRWGFGETKSIKHPDDWTKPSTIRGLLLGYDIPLWPKQHLCRTCQYQSKLCISYATIKLAIIDKSPYYIPVNYYTN